MLAGVFEMDKESMSDILWQNTLKLFNLPDMEPSEEEPEYSDKGSKSETRSKTP